MLATNSYDFKNFFTDFGLTASLRRALSGAEPPGQGVGRAPGNISSSTHVMTT